MQNDFGEFRLLSKIVFKRSFYAEWSPILVHHNLPIKTQGDARQVKIDAAFWACVLSGFCAIATQSDGH